MFCFTKTSTHFLLLLNLILFASGASSRNHNGEDELWSPIYETPSQSQDISDNILAMHLNTAKLDLTSQNDEGSITLHLPLPNSEKVLFKLFSQSVMPPALRAKFPQIKSLEGPSVGYRRQLRAVVSYGPAGGFRAFIMDSNNQYWIDPTDVSKSEYKVYSSEQASRFESFGNLKNWSCSQLEPQNAKIGNHNRVHDSQVQQQPDSYSVYKFTLAVSTNGQYSSFYGNNKERIIEEIVRVVSQANGIYKRDVGVVFELHPNNDDLICLSPCQLSNNDLVLFENENFMASRGVFRSSYDIGHVLTTIGGGAAYVGSTCYNGFYRAGAFTGTYNPSTAEFVAIFAHELGHQLGAGHSWSICSRSNQYGPNTVEPGSGSTTMSYGGVCIGTENIVRERDFYFHSASISEMRDFLSTTPSIFDCGEDKFIPSETKSEIVKKCTVPVGSYFQLGSRDPLKANYFSFDQSSSIQRFGPSFYYTNFLDRSVPRFRSWVFTERSSRSFPNLFYIIHGLNDAVLDEVLPETDFSMDFYVTARSKEYTPVVSSSQSFSDFATVSRTEISVDFNASLRFQITNPESFRSVRSGDSVSVVVNATNSDTAAQRVGLYFALHDPAMDLGDYIPNNPNSPLDFNGKIVDLDWRKQLELPLEQDSFTISFDLPVFDWAPSGVLDIHMMLRTLDSDECYFFDLVPFIQYDNSG